MPTPPADVPVPLGSPPARLLSVLMPVYNERATLRTIVRRVLASPTPIPLEVIAVDDGSTDGSREILRELAATDPRLKPVFHEQNTGKGGAIHTAIQYMKGDIAVVQDADLEYDPAELPRLLRPILEGHADAVFGSRFLAREYRRVLYYWHSLGNQTLTWLCNVVSNLNLTDMETCYKVVRADILKQLRLRCQRFGLEPELTIRLAQWGARIYEVPINYAGRTYLEGKKITWRDGLKALGTILWCGFIDRRFTYHDGFYILTAVRNAGGFNRWMLEQLEPFLGRRVLEAGCGTGNLTQLMLKREQLVCVDVDPIYLEQIERRFGQRENFTCFPLDLADPAGYAALRDAALDSIVCLNVLEHIPDDVGVLHRFYDTLQPGGHAIILVPQHPWLYSGLDRTLGHCRRYTAAELGGKMEEAGFEVVHQQGFNKLGTLGWFVSGKIFRREHLTPRQMKWFNRLLGVARLLEKLPGLPAQSLIMVGRKPAAGTSRDGARRETQHHAPGPFATRTNNAA